MTVVVTAVHYHRHQPLPRALLNARHGGGGHGAEQSRDPALGSMRGRVWVQYQGACPLSHLG